MSWRCGLALLAALLAGCGPAPEVAPAPEAVPQPENVAVPEAKMDPPPAARLVPVETRPFEEGYEAGYTKGLGAGKVGAKLPPTSAAEEIARAEAGQDAARTERWQRGFVDGYLDGFRKVVTGQK